MSVDWGEFKKNLSGLNFKENVSLKLLTTMQVGGEARFLVLPKTIKNLKRIVGLCSTFGAKFFVIGAGSNIIASDAGFDGVLISLEKLKPIIKKRGTKIVAGAGARLSSVVQYAKVKRLGGLEWAVGIPASIGGAVFMNCGAFGGDIAGVICRVWALENGKIICYKKADCNFGYRSSSFQTNGAIILMAELKLTRGKMFDISELMSINVARRLSTQPTGASCGSVFKQNAKPAGQIIDELGYKGTRVGGAVVSDKHANFIINTGNAKSADVMQLINEIKYCAKEKMGLDLEPEIIYLGEKDEDFRRFSHTFKI